MFNHLNKKILLVGASQMAIDYYIVIKEMQCDVIVVGRGTESAEIFEKKTNSRIITGGIDNFLKNNSHNFDAAIVAVGMEQLASTTIQLLSNGFKNILVEKPAGLNSYEIKELAQCAKQYNATILVAYNRRFHASVLKAREIIKQDGGVTSFNFEFTEWSHIIETLDKKPGIKENLLIGNSSHVIDLAFYLGGKPSEISCYTAGKLSWHDKAVFAGAGKTKDNVLFSYQANWAAPGRWGVEVLTQNFRLILRPWKNCKYR